MKKTIVLFLLFHFIKLNSFSQSAGKPLIIGIGGLFNFQTEGKAVDARVMLPLAEGFYFTPRASYFPSSNKIHEYYAGADIDYYLLLLRKVTPYVYLGGYYDNWINYTEFHNKLAKKNNMVPEGGAGLIFNFGCINPYLEYRYDGKWKEGSLGAGLMITLGGGCFSSKTPSSERCPHF